MKKLLLLVGFIIFLNSNYIFAEEKDEEPIDIEEVIKLGTYQPIEKLPTSPVFLDLKFKF